jgi:hypothetical protein
MLLNFKKYTNDMLLALNWQVSTCSMPIVTDADWDGKLPIVTLPIVTV